MSRRHAAEKRKVLPEPKYGDVVLAKFINNLMIDGKKSTAERIVYGALDIMKSKTGQDPVEQFHTALENIRPAVEVRSRRVGGATYQVPVEVRRERKRALAIRWIVDAARKRGEKIISLKLAGEISDAYNKRGNSYKKREDSHKMAEANKAFAHYRW